MPLFVSEGVIFTMVQTFGLLTVSGSIEYVLIAAIPDAELMRAIRLLSFKFE